MNIKTQKGVMGMFYSENWLADLGKLAGAIASGGAVTFGFLKWYLPYRAQAKEVRRTFEGLESLRESLSILEHAVHHEKIAQRAIIFAGHNDGGFPTAASPYYVSALHWTAESEVITRRIEDYRRITVDGEYCEMISALIKNKFVLIDPDKMKDGMLKKIYELEGVSHALICFLGVRNRKLLYASFAKVGSGGMFDDNEITSLKLAANRIAEQIL